MIERYRGIIIKDGQLVVMKRHRAGKLFYVYPGGGREGDETPEQCCIRELKEEFGIDVVPRNMIYKITEPEKDTTQGFFVCDWVSGDIHITDGEEYTTKDVNVDGTYEPMTIPVADIKLYNLLPEVITEQLLKDLQDYGEELNRPLLRLISHWQ